MRTFVSLSSATILSETMSTRSTTEATKDSLCRHNERKRRSRSQTLQLLPTHLCSSPAKVAFGGIFLDAVLSTRKHKTFRYGNNWVLLGLVVSVPFRRDRPFCVPMLWRVYEKRGTKTKAEHRTKVDLAADMIRTLAGWLPGHEILVLADSAYIAKGLLKDRPANGISTRRRANGKRQALCVRQTCPRSSSPLKQRTSSCRQRHYRVDRLRGTNRWTVLSPRIRRSRSDWFAAYMTPCSAHGVFQSAFI